MGVHFKDSLVFKIESGGSSEPWPTNGALGFTVENCWLERASAIPSAMPAAFKRGEIGLGYVFGYPDRLGSYTRNYHPDAAMQQKIIDRPFWPQRKEGDLIGAA